MSVSRQLRRAAERAQRKEERKALKKSLANQTEPDSSAVRTPETFDSVAAGASVCPRFFSSSSTPGPGPSGPRTSAGKAISCLNNLKHGLTGAFRVLQFESQSEFDAAHQALVAEHNPTTPTESQLIRRMAEHAWLSHRAQLLQDKALMEDDEKRFSFYQTTNDRGFRACLNDLIRLRKEQRGTHLNDARVRLVNARAAHLELDTELRSRVDAPIPGYSGIPVEQVKSLFQTAMTRLKRETDLKTAA